MNVGKPVGFKYMSDGRTDGQTDRRTPGQCSTFTPIVRDTIRYEMLF